MQVTRIQRLPPLVALVLAACSLIPAEVQRELLPSNTSYKTAEAAFQVLIERHVDKPASNVLLTGALTSVLDEAQKEGLNTGALPGEPPRFSGSTWSDFSRFTDRLDAIVKVTPNADRIKLERAAVEGMAKSMNECHTYYLDPDRAQRFNQPSPTACSRPCAGSARAAGRRSASTCGATRAAISPPPSTSRAPSCARVRSCIRPAATAAERRSR